MVQLCTLHAVYLWKSLFDFLCWNVHWKMHRWDGSKRTFQWMPYNRGLESNPLNFDIFNISATLSRCDKRFDFSVQHEVKRRNGHGYEWIWEQFFAITSTIWKCGVSVNFALLKSSMRFLLQCILIVEMRLSFIHSNHTCLFVFASLFIQAKMSRHQVSWVREEGVERKRKNKNNNISTTTPRTKIFLH